MELPPECCHYSQNHGKLVKMQMSGPHLTHTSGWLGRGLGICILTSTLAHWLHTRVGTPAPGVVLISPILVVHYRTLLFPDSTTRL